jgi:hypothetical protein
MSRLSFRAPRELEACFAAPAPDDDTDEQPVGTGVALETLAGWVDRIPPIERVALALHCSGLSHRAIGYQLGMSHPGARKRLRRATERLRFLAFWVGTHLTQVELHEALQRHLAPATVAVLVTLTRTTSIAGTARVLGVTRRHVRYRMVTGLDELSRLRTAHQDLEPYHLALIELRQHLGILHEGRAQHRYGSIAA